MEDYFNLESSRLRYRALTEEDIPRWITFFEKNNMLQFLGIDVDADKKALAEQWIRIQMEINKEKRLGHLAVIEKESKEFIGLGGILPRELDGEKEYEVSYSLIPAYWGKGYGTEIAKKIKDYAVKNIDHPRFISIIERSNYASANIAKKNGMSILFETEFRGMKVNVFGTNPSK